MAIKKLTILVGLLFLLWMSYNIVARTKKKVIFQERALSEKFIRLYSILDSTVFPFSDSSGTILIFFNSECEHCQYEMEEIKKNKPLFAQKELILLSSENISAIKKFAEQVGLSQEPNIHFAKINAADVFPTFGSLSVPHIFIYGKDRKLIKEFKGETKAELVLKYLPDR